MKETYTKIGSWAFLIGILVAFIVGIYQGYSLEIQQNFFETITGGITAWILAIIGIVMGAFAVMGEGTITKKEFSGFLLSGIAFVVMGGVFEGWQTSISPYLGSFLTGITMSISVLVAPAVGIIALKTIWDIGKDR